MIAKDYLDSILDDREQDLVRQFVENKEMMEAVKKTIMVGLYHNGSLRKGVPSNPLYNAAFTVAANARETKATNEQIGEDLRALWQGLNALESALSAMAKYKREELPKVVKNPAR